MFAAICLALPDDWIHARGNMDNEISQCITTIIRTLCEAARQDSLLRAIDSIHLASAQSVRILVVVNGERFCPQLFDELCRRRDIEVLQIPEASLTAAHLVGRRAVATEYFSYLDDDDEYLPGALDIRLRMLNDDSSADLVVTNGLVCCGGREQLLYSRLERVHAEPLRELFQQNWLHNCNHLFRTSSVTVEYFEDSPPYMEWTWLGFRLAMDRKHIIAVDDVTFRYNDTLGSLSKSSSFLLSRVALYRRMLSTSPDRRIARLIGERLSSAWHDVSVLELSRGEKSEAIWAHMQSLFCHWSGLRFLTYTRHFFCW